MAPAASLPGRREAGRMLACSLPALQQEFCCRSGSRAHACMRAHPLGSGDAVLLAPVALAALVALVALALLALALALPAVPLLPRPDLAPRTGLSISAQNTASRQRGTLPAACDSWQAMRLGAA